MGALLELNRPSLGITPRCIRHVDLHSNTCNNILKLNPDLTIVRFTGRGVSVAIAARLCSSLRSRKVAFLFNSDVEHDAIRTVFASGCGTILVGPVSSEDLLEGVRGTLCGGIYVSAVARGILFPEAWKGRAEELTEREYEVINLLKRGLAYKQIADVLQISASTVNNHMASLRAKLRVHSGLEAVQKMFHP